MNNFLNTIEDIENWLKEYNINGYNIIINKIIFII